MMKWGIIINYSLSLTISLFLTIIFTFNSFCQEIFIYFWHWKELQKVKQVIVYVLHIIGFKIHYQVHSHRPKVSTQSRLGVLTFKKTRQNYNQNIKFKIMHSLFQTLWQKCGSKWWWYVTAKSVFFRQFDKFYARAGLL